jgi:lysophospholipase L1-like esterase
VELRKHHLSAAALMLAAACGGSGSGPTPPPPPPTTAPAIVCPADLTVREVRNSTQPVTFTAPTTTGGASPVTVACNPASGSDFRLGTTAVTCAASDAQSRAAACSFNVTLTGFTLGAVRFDAFGDSLTEGETGRPSIVLPFLDPPNAYPTRLQAAFDDTYPGQGIVVINRGLSGDSVEATESKMRQFLPVDRHDATLLLTGYNDLTGWCAPGRGGSGECASAIGKVAAGLSACFRRIREANVGVRHMFLSNLTPPGPSGSNRIDGNAIVQVNARVRQVAEAEGAVLVDAYSAFVGHEAEYVNVDGLHLRPAGYQALADAFFAAIKATIPQTPLLTRSR